MKKEKDLAYQIYQTKESLAYKKFPFKPDLSRSRDSNTSSRSISPTIRSSTSFYESQNRWQKKKENKIAFLEKQLNSDRKVLHPFKPKINEKEMEDDEKFILKHVDKMEEYVTMRQKFLKLQKTKKTEELHKSCYCHKPQKFSPR